MSGERLRIVAIDGVLGSGKTTVARQVALALGIDYLDTGAMYRSVAWAALRNGLSLEPIDERGVTTLAQGLMIEIDAAHVQVNGIDVADAIRAGEVARAASVVATLAGVRRAMVDQQRDWARRRGAGVLEGRDIATVVFPDAAVKVFLTAELRERSRRRHAEMPEQTLEQIEADLRWRDHNDSTRAVDPLQVAAGATVIDTTGMSVVDVVDRIVALVPWNRSAPNDAEGQRT